MFFINIKNDNSEKRVAILNEVRSFVGTINFPSNSKIVIKSRHIDIDNDKFYFAFNSQGTFNFGFTSDEESIDSLNNVMNEVSTKLMQRLNQEEKIEIRVFSICEYNLGNRIDYFSKILQQKSLSDICCKHKDIVPRRIDVECKTTDKKGSFEISFRKEKDHDTLTIEFSGEKSTQFTLNVTREMANYLQETANCIINNLNGGS